MTKFRARIDIKFDAEDIDDALWVLADGFKNRAEGKDDIWFEGTISIKPCELEGGDKNE